MQSLKIKFTDGNRNGKETRKLGRQRWAKTYSEEHLLKNIRNEGKGRWCNGETGNKIRWGWLTLARLRNV